MTIRNVYLTTESGDEYTAKTAKLYPRYVVIRGVQISLDEVVRLDYDLEITGEVVTSNE